MAKRKVAKNPRQKKGKWIQGAIKHPGALHRQMGIKPGTKIGTARLKKAAKAKGTLGRRARLALTLSELNKKKKRRKK